MTREELRAAVVAAETWYFGGASGSEIGLEQDQKHLATLRAFLDSGLTDSERETVAKAVVRLAAMALDMANDGEKVWANGLDETVIALAPIAEGK